MGSDDLSGQKKVLEGFLSGQDGQKTNAKVKVDSVLSTIRELEAMPVTKDLLNKSKIGIVMNRVRKSEDEQVQAAATKVLMKWKDVMLPASGSSSEKKRKLSDAEETEKKGNANTERATGSSGSAAPLALASFSLQSFYIGDGVRDKCFEMLVSALMVDQQRQSESAEGDSSGSAPDEIVITTAQSIERCLFAEFQAVTPAYKAKFRSKYLNLNDRNNPTLRNALVSGMINAERFCQMTAAEMASDERKRIDAKIAEQNLLNSQVAKDTAAETDQFKCSRCQKRRCKYYQMQTRSADEPMTTFVTCVNCGNRWRFC